MRVYIVFTENVYDDDEMVKAFLSKEKAEKYVEDQPRGEWWIEDIEVDEDEDAASS